MVSLVVEFVVALIVGDVIAEFLLFFANHADLRLVVDEVSQLF